MAQPAAAPPPKPTSQGSGLTLVALILVAAVANLNLAVANVALPAISVAFDTTQTMLNMIAVGYSLGLAASVLYLGAVGDRYGRKLLMLLGVGLSIPACLMAAYAPSAEALALARVLGGLSAGLAYPTTLSLITAIWSGQPRTRAIALWSAVGGATMALGPLIAGGLLEVFWWGSIFLVTLPLALVALVLGWRTVPARVNESTEPVDHIGGVLSVVTVGLLVVSINFAPVPGAFKAAVILFAGSVLCAVLFIGRQRRAPNPLYELAVARRRIFWVAAVAGIIVFGTLMGSMFVGQQFLQNVLGFDTLVAGCASLSAALAMVLVAPRSAKMIQRFGSRITLLSGYACFLLAFTMMLLLWREGTSFALVAVTFLFVGVGAGIAGTPASHSLTGSAPVRRAGMASGTADLQRDLGGAIMQAIQGALLTIGYATAIAASAARAPTHVTDETLAQLQKSFAGAEAIAQQHPQYAPQIVEAAKQAFLSGANWAYAAGIVTLLVGAVIVFFVYPKKAGELELFEQYAAEDAEAEAEADDSVPAGPGTQP